jgi:hypothetical protein
MSVDDLLSIGFQDHAGALRAPAGSEVCFVPLDARCLRLVVTLPDGATVTAVVAGLAIKIEEAAR